MVRLRWRYCARVGAGCRVTYVDRLDEDIPVVRLLRCLRGDVDSCAVTCYASLSILPTVVLRFFNEG